MNYFALFLLVTYHKGCTNKDHSQKLWYRSYANKQDDETKTTHMQRHFSHDAMTQSILLFVECCELSSRGRALFYRHYVFFVPNLES